MNRATRWALAFCLIGGCMPPQFMMNPSKVALPSAKDDELTTAKPPICAADVNETNARQKAKELADELARDGG